MKMTRPSFVLSLAAAVAFTLGAAPRILADQPLIDKAIEDLETAKKLSTNPGWLLQKAKRALSEGGEHREAIVHIDEALAALRHDDKSKSYHDEYERFKESVDEAIHALREGKDDAR